MEIDKNEAKYVRFAEKKDLSLTSRDTLRLIMWREWKFLATIVRRYSGQETLCASTFQNITDSDDFFFSRTRNALRIHNRSHREH